MKETEKNSKTEESIDFVTLYYCKGAFDADRALRMIRFLPSVPWWRRRGVVAAAIGGALVASAAVFTYIVPDREEGGNLPTEQVVTPAVETPAATEVKKIEFADAPLARVVEEIERVYNVKVTNLPAGGDYRLTLSYEGTAEDLVETINDLLGTSLAVER